MMRIEVGDYVRSHKGCRVKGRITRRQIIEVIEIGRKWRNFDAIIGLKPNGVKHMFLIKNLYKVKLK